MKVMSSSSIQLEHNQQKISQSELYMQTLYVISGHALTMRVPYLEVYALFRSVYTPGTAYTLLGVCVRTSLDVSV